MPPKTCLLLALASLAVAMPLPADESTEPTLMAERGKLLFADDLDAAPGAAWRIGPGRWEAAGGALSGSERASDNHGAVIRHAMPFRDAVIRYSFRLDGARGTTLSINTAKAHLCRVLVDANSFSVRKDDADKQGPDKAVVFQTVKVPVAPGTWHTLVVELCGEEMLATLDGEHVAYGSHPALGVDKANLGLTVSGTSASFKGLRAWEARRKPDWEATKAKLRGGRATSAASGG
jgi:hypothetical protein